jgi:hypothetical protein
MRSHITESLAPLLVPSDCASFNLRPNRRRCHHTTVLIPFSRGHERPIIVGFQVDFWTRKDIYIALMCFEAP